MDMAARGLHKTLSELLNQLSDVTDTGLRDIMRVANALAEGDLTQTMTKDLPPACSGRPRTASTPPWKT